MMYCMPQDQYDFITTIQKECLEATNMTENEAWSFGFRCWQLGYAKQKKGKWVDNGERDILGVPTPFAISCSECGSSAGAKWNKYCPNCGAKMDGD